MYKIYKHNNGLYIVFLLVKDGMVVSRTYKGWSQGWNGDFELDYEWHPWGGPPNRGIRLDKPNTFWNDGNPLQESNQLEFLIVTGKTLEDTIKRFHIRQKRKQRYWTQKRRKQNESKKEERKGKKAKKAKRRTNLRGKGKSN